MSAQGPAPAIVEINPDCMSTRRIRLFALSETNRLESLTATPVGMHIAALVA
jgi:hypothetical protein